MTLSILLPLCVALPMCGAIVSALLTSHRWLALWSITVALIQCVVAAWLFIALAKTTTATLSYPLAGWHAPLGIDLYADSWTALFIALSASIALLLTLYSSVYFTQSAISRSFWPLWWWLLTGLNALWLAADLFTLYITLEVMSLAAIALVAVTQTTSALHAALRYLLVSLLGSLCYLFGVSLLYRAFGTLDMLQLASAITAQPISYAALVSITIGLLVKTALVPVHAWLPAAHAVAAAPVSAMLSAVVVKTTFVLLLIFWGTLFAPLLASYAWQLLGALGAIAIIYGSIQACRASRLKYLVAYSTVAQLGYLFLLFPLIGSGQPQLVVSAVVATIYFMLAHALAKATMFVSVGTIQQLSGDDSVAHSYQNMARAPLNIIVFGIAGASLIGLPPTGGFIAKWLLLSAALEAGDGWLVAIIVVGGVLACGYVFKVLQYALHSDGAVPPRADCSLAARGLTACGIVLAVMTVALGFLANAIIALITDHATVLAVLPS